jgi:hypothetical protein
VERIALRIGLVLLLASGVYTYSSGKEDEAVNSTMIVAELPLIDRVIPATLETATFALG